ncbi:hypothetical protein [Photobacterium lipolyticum]|uniref:DUF1127 domain-containing protein n=1 Tax=Photobacterium lipolyticum TaxID=266810 RepID=A0A2T3MW48_9GAMM|nr:hypothetical protein [Photobacterium lipolyticum]PSW04203.1 hypothetical protein C9I89_14595 [Photobacterium lipolyticum]
MRQSVYLHMAVLFIRLDIHRENEAWRRVHRRIRVDLPHVSKHILQDIGVGDDCRLESGFGSTQAERKVSLLRREYQSRLVT